MHVVIEYRGGGVGSSSRSSIGLPPAAYYINAVHIKSELLCFSSCMCMGYRVWLGI
jgi:hypothetical protein